MFGNVVTCESPELHIIHLQCHLSDWNLTCASTRHSLSVSVVTQPLIVLCWASHVTPAPLVH